MISELYDSTLNDFSLGIKWNIQNLLANYNMGGEIIGTDSLGEELKSNCFGTVAYVHEINYPRRDSKGDTHAAYPVENRPGYLGASLFEEILSREFIESLPEREGVVVFSN